MMTLAEAITWAQNLSDQDLRWALMIIGDDPTFYPPAHTQAIIHETLSRMGNNG